MVRSGHAETSQSAGRVQWAESALSSTSGSGCLPENRLRNQNSLNLPVREGRSAQELKLNDVNILTSDLEIGEDESSHFSRARREKFNHGTPLKNALRRVFRTTGQGSITRPAFMKKQAKVKPLPRVKITKDVYIPNAISVDNLAKLLKVKRERLDDVMHELQMGSADYSRILKSDDACLVAMELQYNPIVDDVAAFDVYSEPIPSDRSQLPMRPPIVTIMGHVDHGKTTLLDTLRSASVASGESGGITQHIGAFSVPLASLSVTTSSEVSQSVTFLDTPGHAAFSAMRARGANVTDIIVLVVAADDGVMPQTREVIKLAQQDAKVQMIVAINKCDKAGVDVSEIKHALLSEGVELEEFGGEVPCVEVSGLTGLGLDKLMETIIAVAEVSDLRAEKDLRAHGHVLEARMDKGRGPIATVVVSRGTLKRGDSIVAGFAWAKVRQMTDDKGKTVDSASPGTPVTVAGWKELPMAGDEVLASSGKSAADDVKRAVANRLRERDAAALMGDLESISAKRKLEKKRRDEIVATTEPRKFSKNGALIAGGRKTNVAAGTTVSAYAHSEDSGGPKELKIIVKADVSGTVEAIVGAISFIGNECAKVCIVQSGVGDVTDSDVDMAAASQAMILGFNITVPRAIESMASQSKVSVHVDSVIYRLIEEVTKRVTDLLPKIIETRVVGEAKVQQLFSIKRGKEQASVAGCRVVNGTLEKHKTVRVVRDGKVVGEGKLNELRHLKSEVDEVRKGMECGLMFDSFEAFTEGDLIQAYDIIEVPASL